jgi:hypothetical protein
MTEAVWQRAVDWVGTEVEDSFVMIHLDTGTYLTLNRTASAVWDALETPQTQGAIEDRLRAQFDVDASTCSAAVGNLLAEMRGHQLASPV